MPEGLPAGGKLVDDGIVSGRTILSGADPARGAGRGWYAACKRAVMNDTTSGAGAAGRPKAPRSLWNRLRGSGILQEADLIRIYRIAQQSGIAPEAAALALGILTEKQLSQP